MCFDNRIHCEWHTTTQNGLLGVLGAKMSHKDSPGRATEAAGAGQSISKCSPTKTAETNVLVTGHRSNNGPSERARDVDTHERTAPEAAAEDDRYGIRRGSDQGSPMREKRQRTGNTSLAAPEIIGQASSSK